MQRKEDVVSGLLVKRREGSSPQPLSEVKQELQVCLGKPRKRQAKGGSSESLCNPAAAAILIAILSRLNPPADTSFKPTAVNKAPAMIYSASYAAVW